MASKVLKCTCVHQFQDKTYGTGMRVHNPLQDKKNGVLEYKCTVCGNVKRLTNSKEKAKVIN